MPITAPIPQGSYQAASELVSKDVSLVWGTYGSSCAMARRPHLR